MIQFDPSKLSVEIVLLKTITTSLGGSITVVDEPQSVGKQEVYIRQVVPLAVARSFIMSTKKVTRYLKPVYTALVKYDGLVVCMERHPLASMGAKEEEGFDGTVRRWMPGAQHTIAEKLLPLLAADSRTWYFDGRYMYAFMINNVDAAIRGGTYLTSDGRFRKVMVQTVDLLAIHNPQVFAIAERSCLAFVTARGDVSVSPPIWKDLSAVGATHARASASASEENDDDDEFEDDAPAAPAFSFDAIDQTMSVNLNFTLKAGQEIGKTFGYEHVEPLNLPQLMIELHTVNLPNVPLQVKATYDVGIKFTHALAWLLGIARRANTLDTYLMMRSLMKYLTKKGIFRNNTFDAAHVFVDGATISSVPLCSLDTLLTDPQGHMSMGTLLDHVRSDARQRRKNEHDIHQIAGLLNED